MKIILVCDGVTAGRGGAERVAVWLANGLARQGHQVMLFTDDSLRREVVYPLDAQVSLVFYEKGERACDIAAMKQVIADCQPDICIVFCWHKLLLTWAVALHGLNIPLVASEHASPGFVEGHCWNREDRLTAFCGADAIHLLSEEYVDSLPEELREFAHVIPNPLPHVDTPREQHSHAERRILLSVGGLHENKQRDVLIDAFAALQPRFPQWQLHIWGEGAERARLEQQIVRLGMTHGVFLHGETAHIFEKYREADLYCVSSQDESFCLALGEALAHGLPAVGFAQCPGVNALIVPGQNGLLAQDMTADSLAQALETLMADEALRTALGQQAPASIAKYREDVILGQWEQLLKSVVDRKKCTHCACMPYSYLLQRCFDAGNTRTYERMLADTAELERLYASRGWKLLEFARRCKSRLLWWRRT